MEQINLITLKARELLGVRWIHNGRDKRGIDCIGVVLYACVEAGFGDGGMSRIYPKRPGREFLKLFTGHKDIFEVPITQTREGDIAILSYATHPTHCGIVGTDKEGNLTVIHSIASRKMVVEDRLENIMKCKHVMTFRVKGN